MQLVGVFGSEEKGVLGAGSIPVAILPSCQDTIHPLMGSNSS